MPMETVLRFTDPITGDTAEAVPPALQMSRVDPEFLPATWFTIQGEYLCGISRQILADRMKATPAIETPDLLLPATLDERTLYGI